MPAPPTTADEVLRAAARVADVEVNGAELIRDGSHVMYRVPGGIVARVGRPGTGRTAAREVEVAHWLAEAGLSVTKPVAGITQSVLVEDQPVTWWQLLPEHRPATPAELGSLLRALHDLPVPVSLQLPVADPFADLDRRFEGSRALGADDRAWLLGHLTDLRRRYQDLCLGKPRHVIHGDAWQGNVAVPDTGTPILLDLEDVAVGHPDWDLLPLAVDRTDFARIDEQDYFAFVRAYGGYDVTMTPGFRVLAGIQELRWASFVISKSEHSRAAREEAQHRLACLRGAVPRPWTWSAF